MSWWLCPNDPPCPHGAIVHDIAEMDDEWPTCCVEGCSCGITPAAALAALASDPAPAVAAGEQAPREGA